MKKYMILTSMLALCACHSGGGHHDDIPSFIDPVQPAIDMPGTVQKWNDAGNSTANALADKGGQGDIFIFNVDNDGNITSVIHDGRSYLSTGEANKYVYAALGETRTMELATLGREAGLQFADFGYAQETEQERTKTDRDFYVFTGGKNLIQNPDVKGATFTGTAVAYIEADMPDRIANQVSKTDDATLVVDASGNHTMTMEFSKAANPWYDVTYKNGVITLSNGDNVANDFKVTDSMVASDQYNQHQFYGADSNVTEVTYRVGAEYKDNATGREVEFDAAFGGKKQ